jgi:hypothetical protein
MKQISVADYEKIKSDAERLKILGVTLFTPPSHQWMQKVCKHSRRNSKFQGVTGVNWQRLVK